MGTVETLIWGFSCPASALVSAVENTSIDGVRPLELLGELDLDRNGVANVSSCWSTSLLSTNLVIKPVMSSSFRPQSLRLPAQAPGTNLLTPSCSGRKPRNYDDAV